MSAPSPQIIREHGLSEAEYARIETALGRAPNLTELGIFSVMWSEHCSYKSSRRHLAKFPTDGPQVIQGPGENAGVVDIGDGLAAVFKMESHNHPSFIEPYQGAATGVGGILRDVFTMGARPVALLNALRFGAVDHPRTRALLSGVVAGIAGYGNCVGVPTVAGETEFDEGYNGNILVNAMAVGIAPADRIFYARGARPGSPILYVGAKTGRDGIHGATMASAEFGEDAAEKRPTVQVGDPFTEKLLIEACLELMASDAIEAIQDMGAAGLTSSSVEMASKGDVGIELELDLVPQREAGMSAYEMMLSESQERMLMVLKPGREAEAEAVFRKWDLDAAVIGRTTGTGRLVLVHRGERVCDIPVAPLVDEAPNYDRPALIPSAPPRLDAAATDDPDDCAVALRTLMACPDLCSRAWIFEQYDRHVMGDTASSSEDGADAALIRVHGTDKALALTADCTPRYVAADPCMGGRQAVAEAYRNLTATGARPLAVTDNLNFGNPERPEIMGQIVAAIDGMAEACAALDMPVVSGNVSLYNETDGAAIPPTPVIGALGLLEDITKRVSVGGAEDGDYLLCVGPPGEGWLGASLYLRDVLGRRDGAPPPVDLAEERAVGEAVRGLIGAGLVRAVHDISDGGLGVAAAEMALASGRGVTLEPPADGSLAGALFGEDQARYLLGVAGDRLAEVEARLARADVPVRRWGRFGGEAVSIHRAGRTDRVSLHDLARVHGETLPALMA